MDLDIPSDHTVDLKENGKINKYLDLVGGWENLGTLNRYLSAMNELKERQRKKNERSRN